ncbi:MULTISPECIES: DUF1905 domain-containing protein [unclassified Arthrobacter]
MVNRLQQVSCPLVSGGHMLSISVKLRRKLGKELGDTVTVHLTERLN